MSVACILLAAGHSRRFGPTNKLLARLGSRPLILHIVSQLRELRCDRSIAVVAEGTFEELLPDFEIVPPPRSQGKLSGSLIAGIRTAQNYGARQVIVTLGDMPFVRLETLQEIRKRGAEHPVVACCTDKMRSPPASFSDKVFHRLLDLKDDRGAQSMIQNCEQDALVPVDPRQLLDIDTVRDLQNAQAILDSRRMNAPERR